MLSTSSLRNKAELMADKAIEYKAESSVLKLGIGENE